MIGKKVKYKYDSESEGIIVDKIIDVYIQKNDNCALYIPISFYLILLDDNTIIRVKCSAVHKIIC